MDITIIVPCHNGEEYIKNLLVSFHLLNLQGITYEIVFVLDDCTDNTEQIIKTYMSDMNYKIRYCKVNCPGLTRNIGLNFANGKYIWFVDSDDWIIYTEVVQQAIRTLEKTGDELIQINFTSNLYETEHYSMVWQYIFNYNLIRNYRFNDKPNHEDKDFMKEVLTNYPKAKELLFLKVPSYFYNFKRPGSQTTKEREQRQKRISAIEI